MFVRSGDVGPGDFLYYAGYYGRYWSSVGRSSSGAYDLYFYSGNVNPSVSNYRYNGFSVRCVALGSWT